MALSSSQITLSRIDTRTVQLVLKTGERRTILRASFEQAWKRIQAEKELTREEMDVIEGRQGTYMAAILSHLPDIEWFDRPVRLALRPVSKSASNRVGSKWGCRSPQPHQRTPIVAHGF